jgi:glycosyltransferase involved in cell wall biosynthesis
MSDDEVASLYVHPQIKSLVSLTRGEGFGLPILEAAASGLPVIATSWSGHVDFLSLGKYIEIDYSLTEIHPSRIDDRIFIRGSKWAKVNEDDFKKKILKFRNGYSIPKEWAKSLSEKLVQSHSINSIKKLYDETIGDLI